MSKTLTSMLAVLAAACVMTLAIPSATALSIGGGVVELWENGAAPGHGDVVTTSGAGTEADPYVYSLSEDIVIDTQLDDGSDPYGSDFVTTPGAIRLSTNDSSWVTIQMNGNNIRLNGIIDITDGNRGDQGTVVIDMGGGNIIGLGGIVAGGIGSPLEDSNHICKDLKIINAGNIIISKIDLTHADTGGTPKGCDIESTGTVHVNGDLTGPRDMHPGEGNASGYLKVTAAAIHAGAFKTHNNRNGKDIGVIELTALDPGAGFDINAASNTVLANAISASEGIFTKNPDPEAEGSGNATSITLTSVAVVMDSASTLSSTDGDLITINVGVGSPAAPFFAGPVDADINQVVQHSDFRFLRVDVGTQLLNYPGFLGMGAPYSNTRSVQEGDETIDVPAGMMVNEFTLTTEFEDVRGDLQCRPRQGERMLRNEIFPAGEILKKDYLKIDNVGKEEPPTPDKGTLVTVLDAVGEGVYTLTMWVSQERWPIHDVTLEGATVLSNDAPTSGGEIFIEQGDSDPLTVNIEFEATGLSSVVTAKVWSDGEAKIHAVTLASAVGSVPAELNEFTAF